jgi:hypothetical protein
LFGSTFLPLALSFCSSDTRHCINPFLDHSDRLVFPLVSWRTDLRTKRKCDTSFPILYLKLLDIVNGLNSLT